MIELWTQSQIDETLTRERIDQIIEQVGRLPETTVEFANGTKAQIVAADPVAKRVVVDVLSLTAEINYAGEPRVHQVNRKRHTVVVTEFEPIRRQANPLPNLPALDR